jgi:hypothetical protein
MKEDNQQSKRKFFELGIKFGLLATAGTVIASKAMESEPSTNQSPIASGSCRTCPPNRFIYRFTLLRLRGFTPIRATNGT